jgi:hypothetical protein
MIDLLIQMDGDDSLAAEARDTHHRILDAIPESDFRQRVSSSDLARRIQNALTRNTWPSPVARCELRPA